MGDATSLRKWRIKQYVLYSVCIRSISSPTSASTACRAASALAGRPTSVCVPRTRLATRPLTPPIGWAAGEKTRARRRLLPFGIASFFFTFHAAPQRCVASVRGLSSRSVARVFAFIPRLADDGDCNGGSGGGGGGDGGNGPRLLNFFSPSPENVSTAAHYRR